MIAITAGLLILLATPGPANSGLPGGESAAIPTPSFTVLAESSPDRNTLAALTQFPAMRPVLFEATPAEVKTAEVKPSEGKTAEVKSTDAATSVPSAPVPVPGLALENGAALAAAPAYIPVKPYTPVKRTEIPRITLGQQHAWMALTVLQHSTAALDAWSTRKSINSGHGHELNPLMKPFAGSGAIYAAIQVAPLGTDYLARRFMQSQHPTLRKLWWLPQAASSVGFTFSSVNNLRVANGR